MSQLPNVPMSQITHSSTHLFGSLAHWFIDFGSFELVFPLLATAAFAFAFGDDLAQFLVEL
jgi:hypothetical protein